MNLKIKSKMENLCKSIKSEISDGFKSGGNSFGLYGDKNAELMDRQKGDQILKSVFNQMNTMLMLIELTEEE